MDSTYYNTLTEKSLAGDLLDERQCREILLSQDLDTFELIHAAYPIRKKYFGKSVTIHIINNSQNGYCPEDCAYCAQAKTSKADIEEYPLKSDEEILAEAKNAYEKGAFRYCMVFAGRGPTTKRVEHLAGLIRSIKASFPIEICVSAGLLDEAKAKILKNAGLDRLNHNLNTSSGHYDKICTTHTYQDRVKTLTAAKAAGLQLCSGVIVGMNESADDVIEVAKTLRKMEAQSIPVNFLIPIPGSILKDKNLLDTQYCLRVLCLYRFLNPKAEIRVAAGREIHLRGCEVLALYAANSLFLDGYLNARGSSRRNTLQMIKDAGFTIESDIPLDDLLQKEASASSALQMKSQNDLRPFLRV